MARATAEEPKPVADEATDELTQLPWPWASEGNCTASCRFQDFPSSPPPNLSTELPDSVTVVVMVCLPPLV